MQVFDHEKAGESLPCRYIEPGGANGFVYSYDSSDLLVGGAALICVNLKGVLLPESDPTRRSYASRYTEEGMKQRDEIAMRHIVPVIKAARLAGLSVVYAADSSPNIALSSSAIGEVYDTHLNIDPELDFQEPQNDPHEYHVGATASAYADAVAPEPEDYYIRKWTYSGFFGTWMDRLLRNIDVKTVLLCGFDTECDVLCTGLDSTAFGYQTILIRDAVTTACRADYSATMTLNDRWVLHFEEAIGFSIESARLVDYLSRFTARIGS